MTYYAPPEGSYEDSHGYGLLSGALNLRRVVCGARAVMSNQEGLITQRSLVQIRPRNHGSDGNQRGRRQSAPLVSSLDYDGFRPFRCVGVVTGGAR